MKNIFTIDFEEWFCSHALQSHINYEEWDSLESRIVIQTTILLEVLDRYKIKATFFVLGWLAVRYPNIIVQISNGGHEIATHGFSHKLIYNQTPSDFKEDVFRSIQVLKPLSRNLIRGYRAPAFSVTPTTEWALPILKDLELIYDSSIYPISYHPDYGFPSSPKVPFHHSTGLLEIPLNTATIGNIAIPCSGGAYLRFLPYSIFRRLIKNVISKNGFFIFYIHPWELDPAIPKLKLHRLIKTRIYGNLDTTFKKIVRLIDEFEFTSVEQSLPELQSNFNNSISLNLQQLK